jgi:hypothetical protein
MRHIPRTIEEFETKERKWLGFHYALKNIGLEYKEVKQRLQDRLPPWRDEETQRVKCQKAYGEYVNRLPTTTEGTTKPKSKANHQGQRKTQNRKVKCGEKEKEDQRAIDLERNQELEFTVKVLRE